MWIRCQLFQVSFFQIKLGISIYLQFYIYYLHFDLKNKKYAHMQQHINKHKIIKPITTILVVEIADSSPVADVEELDDGVVAGGAEELDT